MMHHAFRRPLLPALIALALLTFTGASRAQIPAFPGAQGFGAYAAGGRGGDVYTVVNLNSSGAGSLRYGIETAPAQGRTIVFAVSGYIPISNNSDTGNKTLRIVQNKVTIAGQTAPGDGIGLKDGRILMTGNNLVLRHLRIRHGKYGGAGDCLNLDSSADNSIVDHISLMFSTDENISFFNSTLDNFTMQYSTSSWGMERHNAGGLWDLQDGTCHHSLWAHHRTRNPKARPFNGVLEWINNVTYHWRTEGFIMGDSQTPANWSANVRGCYFLSIDDYEFGLENKALSKARIASNGQPNFHLYLDNCRHDADGDGLLNGTDKGYDIVDGLPYDPLEGAPAGTVRYGKSLTPFPGATGSATVTIDDPLTAYKKVISSAGALRLDATSTGPLRDELDTLLVNSVQNQESILVAKDTPVTAEDPPSNGEAQLAAPPYNISNGGFGTLNSTPAPTDSDGDGMPDIWELTLGWANGSQDHNTALPTAGGFITGLTFFPANTPAGYTRLEEYLHFRSIPHATINKATTGGTNSLTTDLRKFVSGFNRAPVTFTLSNVTNGTAVLQPDGFTVVFTPTLDFSGRARFDFNVTDGDGSAWNQTLAVLVSAVGLPRDLKWQGDGSANQWNDSALNFLHGATPTAFAVGDNVIFDDTGFNTPDVNLELPLSPGLVNVTAAQAYNFGGSGALSGAARIVKNGSGTLTLGTANSFSGGLELNAGNVTLANSTTAAGLGNINFNGGSLTLTAPGGPAVYNNPVTMTQPGTLFTPGSGNANQALGGPITGSADLSINTAGAGTFSARSGMSLSGYTGTLRLTGTGVFRWQGGTGSSTTAFDLGNSTAVMMTRDGGTITLGALTGGSGSTLRGAGSTANLTTYVVGQKGSSTFAGTITDGNVSGNPVACGINKLGSSTLTLTATNSHTGTTQVGAGTLNILGDNGPSPVTVSANATLAGTGQIGGLLTANSGGRIAPGVNAPGALTASGGIALNTPTMLFELSGSPAGSNDKITMQGGLLTMTGNQNYQFSLLDGYLGSGTYPLIEGGANTSASGVGLLHNLPTGARQTFALQRPPSGNGQCYVNLVVTGDPTTLVWRGLANSNWDQSTFNWVNGVTPERFYNFDTVIFDDTGASAPTITLTTSINPASVLVNASTARTFNGSGALVGPGTLTKAGSGLLTINTTNTSFSGDVALTGGTLTLAAAGARLNIGNLIISGGAVFNMPPSSPAYFYPGTITVPAGQSGTIASPGLGNGFDGNLISGDTNSVLFISSGVSFGKTSSSQFDSFNGTIHILSGATLRFSPNSSGNTYGSLNPTFVINGALRPRNAGNAIQLGALSGIGSIEGPQSNAGSGNTTYIIGGNNLDVTFNGNISSNSAVAGSAVILEKIGTGRLVLGGSSTFTGGTTVAAGSLLVNNATGSGTGTGPLAITAGATLGGTGFISSPTTLADFAILAPGQSAGTLTFNHDLEFGEFSELNFELGTSSDQVVANAGLTLQGRLNVIPGAGFGAGTYTLFNYNPAQTFIYSGLTLGNAPASYHYSFDLSTPGQIKLIVSPLTPPNFAGAFAAGSNLVLTGTGGVPGGAYYVLASSNVALPMAGWTRVATNTFDGSGDFSLTNLINPGQSQLFYRLQLP